MANTSAHATIIEETIEQTHAISSTAKVTVRNTDGRIYIYGSDANELKIRATKRAFSRERVDGIKINVVINGDDVVVDTFYPPAPEDSLLADRSGTVDYLILVPQTCTLAEVTLSKGEIVISGMRGDSLAARLGIGRLEIQDCFAATQATVGEGGIELIYYWWESTTFSVAAEIANGDLRFAFPPEVAVNIDAASMHGEVRQEGVSENPRTLRLEMGEAPRATFQLRALNGNIKIEKLY